MKTVFKNSEVAHIWAKQDQASGRNSANNIYFNGPKIYSYGSHFCMGNIIKPGLVLITDRSYSNTTAKHLNYTRYSVNHLDQVYCPYPEFKLEYQLSTWQARIKEQLSIINSDRPAFSVTIAPFEVSIFSPFARKKTPGTSTINF
jgi:hypothetical protein